MSLIPPINVVGVFSLANPFSTQLKPNTPYTCVAIRKFADILRKGEDPYTLYYAAYGLTQEIFERDSSLGECIVTLRSAAGEYVYVPTSYIVAYPNQSGIPYTAMALVVQLGAIPNYVDLTAVKTKIISEVYSVFGVVPVIQQVNYSETKNKSAADHNAVESARLAAITERVTDNAKLLAARATIQAQAQKIAQLEEYIKQTLPTPP